MIQRLSSISLRRASSNVDDESSPALKGAASTLFTASNNDGDDNKHDLLRTGNEDSSMYPSTFVIKLTAIASLGGILFGYDIGVIGGALPLVTEAFDLSSKQQEITVSILYVGGGLGALLGGSICDSFGRKKAILFTDVWFLIGAITLALAPSFEVLLLGRIIVGFAVAVSGIADVSYLHEISPVRWRGSIVSVNEACISLGFLLAFGMGSLLATEGSTSAWRPMFGASGVIALIQLLGMAGMPESPSWLRDQGRTEESEAALRLIQRKSAHAETTSLTASSSYGSLTDNVNQKPCTNEVPVYSGARLTGLFSYYCRQTLFNLQQQRAFLVESCTSHRRQAMIAAFMAVTQQFCGQTNVLSYAPLIVASVSGNSRASSSYVRGWVTLSIGLVKFFVTALVVWKIESIGRRFLLLAGMTIIAFGLLLMIISFESMPSNYETNEYAAKDPGHGVALAIPGVLLVVTGYSMSFGPLTWLLTSELFPTEIRGRALGASTIITYACAALVTYTFISAQEWTGRPSVVFAMYLLVTSFGLVFAVMAIPDTKEKSVADIEMSLNQMPWWRHGGDANVVNTRSQLQLTTLHNANEDFWSIDTQIT